MKLLKIKVSGLSLFKDKIEIDFIAKQRVSADKNEMLTNVFSNIYLNNVISMVGINASGKTTTLKVVSFVLQMMQNKPINSIKCKDILDNLQSNDEAFIEMFFITDDKWLRKLETTIQLKKSQDDLEKTYVISSEKILQKSTKAIRTKNDLFDFSSAEIITERNHEELFLMEDVSVIIALNKGSKTPLYVLDAINWTNFNGLQVLGDFPIELVRFLDPSIEYLKCVAYEKSDSAFEMHLKFYNKEVILLKTITDVDKYLSSGTIKGINIFIAAIFALQKGGYIIVDEIENHFNKEIVSTLIKFFMDSEINKSGAMLIFSTHYLELLDIFERNDNIYVVKNTSGISIENLADLLKRNDVKKSELFLSGYLENTIPSYEAYINFKRAVIKLPQANEV